MRDHSQHIQLSREEAVAATLAALDAQPEGFGWRGRAAAADHAGKIERKLVERVSLSESVGRVLAYDVCAANDMPSALTCAMDSIALHWSDFADLADGEVPDTSSWVRGRDWQFANTGVAMPEGFDTAIVIEHAQVSADEQHVIIDAAPSKPGAGTRPAGSAMRRGDVLGRAGQLITPDLAARMGSGNNGSVPVVRRPRVAFIPTGNELVAPGVPFDSDRASSFAARGRNFETNSVLVKAKCEQWGGRFVPFDIVPDRRDAIEKAIAQAVEQADIVVLNAGSSKGSDDWSCEVMEQMGQMICHQTNHGPGHHSSFAIVDGTPIVGVSGPSAGASFTLNFYLRPLMRAFLGLDPRCRVRPWCWPRRSRQAATARRSTAARSAARTGPRSIRRTSPESPSSSASSCCEPSMPRTARCAPGPCPGAPAARRVSRPTLITCCPTARASRLPSPAM